MDNKKPNDWVLNVLQNPNFSLSDFKAVGVDGNNTSIENRDVYANNKIIQSNPQFQDSDGNFDNAKFNQFYDNALESYQLLSTNTFNENVMDEATFGFNNIWAPKEASKRTQPDFQISRIYNPDRRKIGVEKVGFTSDRTLTAAEIAQTQKIYNPDTKEWEESPNDSWLFRNWFEPVALAQWEEEGEHIDPETNRKVKHAKGDFKINEEGTYYYEKLGNREPYGKQLLSPFDVLTVDGSKANKYDFFDSDSLDKSVFGSVMKNTFKIAPMFVPYVGPAYIALGISNELAKVLPIIYKTTFGLAGASTDWANKVEAFAYSMDSGTSEYAKQHTWAAENILNMVGDVAKQLYEQRWIFTNAPRLFKSYGISAKGGTPSELDEQISKLAQEYAQTSIKDLPKVFKTLAETGSMDAAQEVIKKEALARATIWGQNYMKSYQEWGKQLSRLYMTGTASCNAFTDAKQEGASDMEAAAVFWGYMAGMYALMSTDIGEHVLPELRSDKAHIKNLLESVSKQAKESISTNAVKAESKEASKNIFAKLFNGAKSFAQQHYKAIADGSTSVMSNALAEGVEEVSEEVLYDVTKATFNAISYFTGNETRLSAFNDMASRYGMSFFGGALGGSIFQGINDIQLRKSYDSSNMQANQELIYLIRQGRGEEIYKALDKMREKGVLGDKNLSATKVDKTSDGKYLYQQGTEGDNQNEAIYSLMKDYVSNIEQVLSTEGMKISDMTLLDKQMLSELRYQELFKNAPSTGKILQDFNNLSDEFLKTHAAIDQLNAEFSDENGKKSKTYADKLALLEQKLDDLRKEQFEFLHTGKRGKYLGMMMFSVNPVINKAFIDINFRMFAESKYKKDFELLSEDDIDKAKEEYADYLKYDANKKLDIAYDVFRNLNEQLSPIFQETGELAYKQYAQLRKNFYNSKIQFVNAEGGLSYKTMTEVINDMFGDQGDTNEDIVEKAERLKRNKDNPFSESSRFLRYTITTPDGELLSNGSELLKQLNQAADIFMTNGYMDKEVADSMRALAQETINVSKEVFFEPPGQSLLDSAYQYISDEAGDIMREFADSNLTITNIKDKTAEVIDKLRAIEGLDDVQKRELDLTINELKHISNSILARNASLLNDANTLIKKLDSAKSNPLYDVLTKIGINVTGKKTNVFDLLQELEQQFSETHISDFALDNKVKQDQIKDARTIIAATRAVIYASQFDNIDAANPFGFNVTLKEFYRKNQIEDAPELGLIDSETAVLMNRDLDRIEMKLDFIENLSNLNKESQLKEQRRTSVNMNYLFFDVVGNENSFLYTKVVNGNTEPRQFDGQPLLNDKVREAINNAVTLRQFTEDQDRTLDISDEDYTTMEKERVAIEDALYDRFQEISNGKDQVAALKSILFDGGLSHEGIASKSEGIRSVTKTLTDSEKLSYITSILGVKSSDFLSRYYTVIKSDTSKLAPIATQEFAVRLAYTLASNRGFVNNVVQAAEMENHVGQSVLLNTIFIEGVPGAGKTKAVARIAYSMIKASDPNIKTWTIGPHKKQSDTLAREIGSQNNTAFTREEVFNKLDVDPDFVNSNDNISLVVSPTGVHNIKIKGLNEREYTKDDLPSVIFLDEATHFTNGELQILADFAAKSNIALILLGDSEQSGNEAMWNLVDGGNDIPIYNSFATTFCLKSPKLTVSMRSSNTNKRDNLIKIRAVLPYVWATNTDMSVNDKWSFISNNLELKYTQDDSGIHGEKVQKTLETGDLELMLSTLKDGETIGYIYDNTESPTYKMINALPDEKKKKFERFKESEAQGSEAKYFIIDIDWNKKRTASKDSAEAAIEVANFVKSLYTISTRSEEGTVIIDNHLTEIVNPDVFIESDYNAPTSYNDDSLNDYKEKRLKALEEILKGYTPTSTTSSQLVTDNPPVTSKLKEGAWIQFKDGSKWKIMSIKDNEYVLANVDKTEYHKYPIEQIDSQLGISVQITTEPTKPAPQQSENPRPDLQKVLIEEAIASEEGRESELEQQKKAQWYAKDDPGFKVYTFAGYRSGVGVETSNGQVVIDSNNNINIIDAGRKYKDNNGQLVDETRSDLQALLDLPPFRNGSTKISYNTYDAAATLLANIRSAIMYAKTNGNALTEVKKLLRGFPKASSLASATSGEFQAKFIQSFYQQTDRTIEMGDKTTPNRKLLVYVLKDRSGKPIAEFTIGVLPGLFTLDNWVQNYVGNDKNIKDKWDRLTNILAKANNVAKVASNTVYIPLGTDFALGPNIISNTKIHKVDEEGRDYTDGAKLKIVPFSEFRNSKSRIVSDIYIMTNVGIDEEFYDKSLSGKAVAFVTTKKDFTWKGIKASNDPNILAEAWMETRGNKDADKLDEVVKVVKLDPKGVNFEDYINGVSAFRRELANKTGNAKLYSPPGNKYTAARIFMNLLQFSKDLKSAIVTGQTVHGITIVDNNKFKFEAGKIEIPRTRVVELIGSLDEMLASAVNRIYGKTDAEKLSTSNVEWGLTGEISQDAINKLDNAIVSKFNDYLENLKNYRDGEVMANFSNEHSFTLARLFHNYFTEFRIDSKTFELRTDAKSQNLLKTITKALQNYEQSSFREGIYYTPVYKTSAEGGGMATAMAYPAINMINNFTVDVEAQTPDFVITGEALQRLADGIERFMTGRPNAQSQVQDYSISNAKALLNAKARFEINREEFKSIIDKVSEVIGLSLSNKTPYLEKDLANQIYSVIKRMAKNRELGLVDPSTEGFVINVLQFTKDDGHVQLLFETLGMALRTKLNQPVTNITIDGSEGSALYSGKFEVNSQQYQWTIDADNNVSYSPIENTETDDAQKSEAVAKIEAELQKLEIRKEKLLNELVGNLKPALAPKIKESVNIILSGNSDTSEYIKAQTMVSKAFSMVPSNLKEEWESLLKEYANNKDALNNLSKTCNY